MAKVSRGRGTRMVAVGAALAVAASILMQVTPIGPGVAPASAQEAERQDYIVRVNALRSSAGLGTLAVDGELQASAQQYSQVMAAGGRLVHAPDVAAGVTTPYDMIDESVAMGPTTEVIFQGLAADRPHYDLMARPSHDRIGVGVTMRDGNQWVVHRYMTTRRSPPVTTAPPTTRPRLPVPDTTPTTRPRLPVPDTTPTTRPRLPVPDTTPPAPPSANPPALPQISTSDQRLMTMLAQLGSYTSKDLQSYVGNVDPSPITRPQATLYDLRESNCHNAASVSELRLLCAKYKLENGGNCHNAASGGVIAGCGSIPPGSTVTPRGTTTPTATTTAPRETTTTRPRTTTTRPPRPARPPPPRRDRPILFVHGINATSNSTDCGDTFDEMIGWMRGFGFKGEMVKVGYYSGDVNCDVNLNRYGALRDSDSWRRIAQLFSQYVYSKYTSKGITVDVVGYSMGGLITRGAIYGSSTRQVRFSPPLDIEHVVTLGTPHDGATLGWWCFAGTQCATLATGNPDLNWLNRNGNPQGKQGTQFTVIGSDNDWVVSVPSAHNMTLPRNRKVRYGDFRFQGRLQQVSHTGDTNYMHNYIVVMRTATAFDSRRGP